MKASSIQLLGVSILALACSTPAAANEAPAPQQADSTTDNTGFADIIVTARREAENLQSVPVAVSVVNAQQIARVGTFKPEDIAQSAPGLSTSGGGDTDRGNIIFSIRGQSFTYGALFPSVITYFNDVPTKYLATGQFYDMDSLQILRGPQGVQFGRVTNGGNVMFAPKKPSDVFEGEVSVKAGDYNLLGSTGFVNVPLSDTLAVRVAWDAARRNGFTQNLYDGRARDDLNYTGGRISVRWKPMDAFEDVATVQYQETDDNGTALVLEGFNPTAVGGAVGNLFPLVNTASEFGLLDPVYGINPQTGAVGAYGANGYSVPLNATNYVNAIQNTLNGQKLLGPRQINSPSPAFSKRKYLYAVNTMTFNINDDIQLKNIVGYTRYIERGAQNYFGDNSGNVQPCHQACPFQPGNGVAFKNEQQISAELRLSGKSFGNRLTWSIGGYMDEQKPGGLQENDTIFGGILEYLLVQRAVTKSRAVYGYAEYDLNDKWKINGGIRYTHDTVHSENANYNALLPVPGLQNMIATNAALFRSFGVPGFAGLTDQQIAGFAAGTANSAALIKHGVCADYNFGAFSGKCTTTDGAFNSTTFTLGTSYQLAPRQLVYVKFSKGYRPGGVNPTFPAGFANLRAFKPENNYSLEGGIKSDFQLGSVPVRTNLAVYRDRYKNIQNAIQIRDSSGNPGSIVTNVAAATVWGIEFEGSIRPMEGLTIGGTYAYTHAKYDLGAINAADVNTPGTASYDACNNTAPVNLGFCTLSDFPIVPKHQASVNVQWDFIRDKEGIGTIGIGGNWYHQSRAASGGSGNYLQPASYRTQPAYSTLNLSANWNGILGSRVDLLVFVTNVTNELYFTTFNVNLERSGIGNLARVYAPPRMFGASLTAHF